MTDINTSEQINVLVYDEDIVMTRQVLGWFKLAGQKADYCSSYDEFLDMLASYDYDLVLFDLNDSSEHDDSLHAISTHYFLSKRNPGTKTSYVLFSNHKVDSYIEMSIDAARAKGVIEKTDNAEILFKQVGIMMGLAENIVNRWVQQRNDSLTKLSLNVVNL